MSTKTEVKYGPSMTVSLDDLSEYVGEDFVVAKPIYRGQDRNKGLVTIVGEGNAITSGLIESLSTVNKRLESYGKDSIEYIEIKKKNLVVPQKDEIITPQQKRIVFEGLSATYSDVKEKIDEIIPDKSKFVKDSLEDTVQKINDVKIVADPGFLESLGKIAEYMMDSEEKGLLFASMSGYHKESGDHSIRASVPTMKILLNCNIKGRIFRKRTISEISDIFYSVLLHDSGKMFIPKEILDKSERFSKEELLSIKNRFENFSNDQNKNGKIMELYNVIEAVNSHNNFYPASTQSYLIEVIKNMDKLVDIKLLTKEQYKMISTYPSSCNLTKQEFEVIKNHPVWSHSLLSTSGFSAIGRDMARHHHEKLDGSGYPDKLGNDMNVWAQILAMADTFDALTSPRSYKQPYPYDVAFDILYEMVFPVKGKQKISEDVFDLFRENISKYPTDTWLFLEGGRLEGCIGYVVQPSSYPNLEDKPEFMLLRNEAGEMFDEPVPITRKDYKHFTRVRGFPYTREVSEMLCSEETEPEKIVELVDMYKGREYK